jgi:hypothetical protein
MLPSFGRSAAKYLAGPRAAVRSLRRPAAVDDEAGAGHEGGIVGGQEDDGIGDVGDGARAVDFVKVVTPPLVRE